MKTCKRCGESFEPVARNQKYCSKECAREAEKELARERRRKWGEKRGSTEGNSPQQGALVAIISKQNGKYLVRFEDSGQKVEEYEVADVVVERIERVRLEV